MKIALRSVKNDKFVCADDGEGTPLHANRDKAQSWEQFEVFIVNDDGSLTSIPKINVVPAPTPVPNPGGTKPISGASPDANYVAAVKANLESVHTNTSGPEGAFNIVKWVVWGLKNAGFTTGLLIKESGENVVEWKGGHYAAGRVCYPDGTIFKILTDVGGANGPTWDANGTVSPSLYAKPIDPAS